MLLVDPAVGSNDLVQPLRAMGLDVDMTPIAADIAFTGRGIGGAPVDIGIEFKKLGELIQALQTERLQGHQLLKMRTAFDFRWLLIEGEVLTDRAGYLVRRAGRKKTVRLPGQVTVTGLYKRLLTLQVAGGLTPVMVETRDQSLKFIEALYRFWTDKDQDQHKSHIAIYEPPTLVPISQFRRTVATLPGIGIALSARVEARFGNLRAAFRAGPSEWCQIDGIGTRLATGIERSLAHK